MSDKGQAAPRSRHIEDAARRRSIVSQVLVAGLVAVAYSEPVAPVTEAFNEHGVSLRSLGWLTVYGLTVLRFLIGDILHLERGDLTVPEAQGKWFFDILVIVAECVILIFAGTVTTLQASSAARVSLIDYLVVLYAVDATWIFAMLALDSLGKSPEHRHRFSSWVRKNDKAPVSWAFINLLLLGFVFALGLAFTRSPPAEWKVALVVAVNIVVFFVDVVTINYGMRQPPELTGGTD
jgi:hypothetical protein